VTHIRDHDFRTGRVTFIAGNGGVQRRLGSIETGHLIAKRSAEPRQPIGSAEQAQQKIAGGVVAQHNRGGAEICDAHSGPDVVPGHGRIARLDIGGHIRNDGIDLLIAHIDQLQHRGCGKKLERAREWKTLISAVFDRLACRGVGDHDAEASAMPRLDGREPIPRRGPRSLRDRF
jgi:hypothetical protein